MVSIASHCMQFIPLAVLKLKIYARYIYPYRIACNSYRLRY